MSIISGNKSKQEQTDVSTPHNQRRRHWHNTRI